MFSDKYVDITSGWQFFWNLCLMIWEWLDSIKLTLGVITFSLFDLFVSIFALLIVWYFTMSLLCHDWFFNTDL